MVMQLQTLPIFLVGSGTENDFYICYCLEKFIWDIRRQPQLFICVFPKAPFRTVTAELSISNKFYFLSDLL